MKTSPYRTAYLPYAEVQQTSDSPKPCHPGSHVRVVDGVNMCMACSVCGCKLEFRSADEFDEAYRERDRFETEYGFTRLKFHGDKSGLGLLRSHWEGIWDADAKPVDRRDTGELSPFQWAVIFLSLVTVAVVFGQR